MKLIKATGAAFNLSEIFMTFDMSKLKVSQKECIKLTHDTHKKSLVFKIFKDCVKLVLDDCIDNNITFELPTGSRKSSIYVKRYSGEDFKRLRQMGKFKNVDFLSSMFSGNQVVLKMGGNGRERIKPIYVNKEMTDRLTEYTNKGKQYC